jgi:N-acetylmuramoyl-L-alanine amidase
MKKADVSVAVYFRIFEILLLVIVIGIVSAEVNNIRDSGIYQKKFLSRDLALMMDSLTNARGNIIYRYMPRLVTLERFEISFTNNAVTVDDESWPYAMNGNYDIILPQKARYSSFVLKKTGNKLFVQDGGVKSMEFNGLLLECPFALLSTSSVIIDPGHRYSDSDDGLSGELKDTQGRTIPESELMLKVAAALEPQLKSKIPEILGTRDLKTNYVAGVLSQQTKTLKERIAFIASKPDSAIISLHAGRQPKSQNIVKAYVNFDADERSYRLACQMLNGISDAFKDKITGTAIIPVIPAQMSQDDPRQILAKGRVAVLIELGNIDYPKNEVLGSPVELAQAIAKGVE